MRRMRRAGADAQSWLGGKRGLRDNRGRKGGGSLMSSRSRHEAGEEGSWNLPLRLENFLSSIPTDPHLMQVFAARNREYAVQKRTRGLWTGALHVRADGGVLSAVGGGVVSKVVPLPGGGGLGGGQWKRAPRFGVLRADGLSWWKTTEHAGTGSLPLGHFFIRRAALAEPGSSDEAGLAALSARTARASSKRGGGGGGGGGRRGAGAGGELQCLVIYGSKTKDGPEERKVIAVRGAEGSGSFLSAVALLLSSNEAAEGRHGLAPGGSGGVGGVHTHARAYERERVRRLGSGTSGQDTHSMGKIKVH
jgi:hypothetical protein